MKKSFLAVFAGLLFAGALSFLAAADAKTGTWKGIVTDQMCAQKGVKLDDADCAAKCVAAGSKTPCMTPAPRRSTFLIHRTRPLSTLAIR